MTTSDPKVTGVSWPWAWWLRYLANQPPLCRMIYWSFLLTFIAQGDGYTCAGGDWSELSTALMNMGLHGDSTACVWVNSLAMSGHKQMDTLATLCKAKNEVRSMHEQLFRRRSGNLFRHYSGSLFERPLRQFGSNDLPLFFQAIHLVVDTKRVVYNARDHTADMRRGGDSP